VYVVSITRRIFTPLTVAAALLAFGAGSAQASLLVAPGEGCNDYTSSQVFLPWADVANYTLAPDANFENNAASSWQLSNAAIVRGDNESYDVGGTSDNASLGIAGGGVATSPAMCVGLQNPTVRVFYKRTSGSALSSLRVDALYEDAYGNTQSLTIGNLGGTGAWTLSPQMAIVANLLPLLDEGTPVAFRFSASGGTFQIDDVYVDPWSRG
jgi:hypothetical protein